MERVKIIQHIIDENNFKSYLEIGCYRGKTFFSIKADKKIAVDPSLEPLFLGRLIWSVIKGQNNKYFKESSDTFFNERRIGKIDIVFIDGLHTFEASLSDVFNSFRHLNQDGVIILHDCCPPTKASALPTKHYPTPKETKNVVGWTGAWCGDVWKTIVYLRKHFRDILDINVLDVETGLGIIRPKKHYDNIVLTSRLIVAPNSFAEIDKLQWRGRNEN